MDTLQQQLDDARHELALLKGDADVMATMEAFGLTRILAKVALAIARSPQISKDAIYHAVYDRRIDHVGTNVIEVHLVRLRRVLKKFDIEIRTLREVGYSMSPAHRVRFKQILEGRG